ncbi:MAG: hypothetical protein HY907_11750 [Deltaproteobacteria bacterium]|nr:hypothetical protein [Deltaproteobacteria bacterium]
MSHRLPATVLLLGSLGCVPQFRTDVVAANRVSYAPVAGPSTLVAEVALAEVQDGDHVLRYAVYLPRALELEYEIRCPAREDGGVMGETFAAYAERRLAELEQERRQQAELVSSLVGAVVPSVQAGARVSAPGVQGSAQAAIDPGDVAASAAYGASPPPQLPAGDVGARTIEGTLELGAAVPGSCVLVLRSPHPEQELAGVVVDLAVERLVDVAAEEQARRAADRQVALEISLEARADVVVALEGAGATRRTATDRERVDFDLRGAVVTGLIAAGADPDRRVRVRAAADAERERLEREAQADLEIRLSLEARQREADAAAAAERARREEEIRQAAFAAAAEARRTAELELQAGFTLRLDVSGYLIALGADPGYRLRLEAEESLRVEQERQANLRAAEEARLASVLALQAGLSLRLDVSGYLIGLGADPGYRARLRTDDANRVEEARREDARLAEEQARRQELDAWQARADAAAAWTLRAQVEAQLVALGAVERPPMPLAPVEVPPPPPFPGAAWISGRYAWSGGIWVWVPGAYAGTAAAGLELGGLAAGLGALTQGGTVTVEIGTQHR